MEPDAIDTVMCRLEPGPYGWRCELPADVRFLGRPVELRVDTQAAPAEGPPPAAEPAEIELARLILGGLPGVLAECARRYREYAADVLGFLGDEAHEPTIWVSRQGLGDEPPGRWSFVVFPDAHDDWGIFIGFSGLKFEEVWSGE